jgi:hypothetical protein
MNATKLTELAARWASAKAAERANFQSYLIELCEALEVERPRPAGSEYEFEYPVKVVNRDGTESTNFIDLYKKDHFLIEAKDQGSSDTDTILLRKAYGQARTYAAALDTSPPPYLLVLDVGRTLFIWDRWNFGYGGFSAAAKINLATLSDNMEGIALLRDIFQRPQSRNPNVRGTAVTREIAGQLAELASSLENRGFDQERIARFLIRCVFTMFAEDTGLIPDMPFSQAIIDIGLNDPADFSVALADMWRAMDQGTRFGLKKFLRFNGHFFRDQEVLTLTKDDLLILKRAAEATWESVEPSIMGTLLVRALDPVERHRLGAEFTPREFVERVVRPTVEEPVRERWTAVQAEVLQLRTHAGLAERTRRERDRQALDRLRQFHDWLRQLRFLDPACGSGNFLYVTLAIIKQVELELLRAIEEITGAPELAVQEVGPWQFYGIEVKPWAREIAELSLWIGYHQWWRRTHGHTMPPEPVLRDTGTLENRDAVLAWSRTSVDLSRARPDPTPRIAHQVTGARVPDPAAVLDYVVYHDFTQAPWPRADFIVGNPPYIGNKRMRDAFGDGYVEALRAAYPEVSNSADYVMYWWYRAAVEVAAGRTIRAGLITTNSITQIYNRTVVQEAAEHGARVIWTIPSHPWIDDADSAAVRVAMTVIAKEPAQATLVQVDDAGVVIRRSEAAQLNADLTVNADVSGAAAVPLLANQGLSSRGYSLVGRGFLLRPDEAETLLKTDPRNAQIVFRYLNGKDLASRARGLFVIDFGVRSEDEAREFATLYDIVRTRVKPDRDANNDKGRKARWWLFGRTNVGLREALHGLPRYIATPYVSKHRFFTFLGIDIAPDEKIVCIASDSETVLGVLSSSVHQAWALAAGSRLGIGNDPTYNNGFCFDSFPFPELTEEQACTIAVAASRIDSHRQNTLSNNEKVTITQLYNVVEKLRLGKPLLDSERLIHDAGACSLLRDLHDDLDQLVLAAYGLPVGIGTDDILTQLVELHHRRRVEEAAGKVRWLRPDYQRARYPNGGETPTLELETEEETPRTAEPSAWPTVTVEQISALQSVLATGGVTVEAAAKRFAGARRDIIARHLETLALMGEARVAPDGSYHAVMPAA